MAHVKDNSRFTILITSIASLRVDLLDLDTAQLIVSIMILHHVDQSMSCTCVHQSSVSWIIGGDLEHILAIRNILMYLGKNLFGFRVLNICDKDFLEVGFFDINVVVFLSIRHRNFPALSHKFRYVNSIVHGETLLV